MNDDELLRLIDEYLDPPRDANPGMAGVQIVWERDTNGFGAMHVWYEHRVTEQEVEQVILEIPPYVEARRHPERPNRTIFWGATAYDRWLFIVCEEWMEGGTRFLKPITAFEPEEGEEYWERYQ
jgi:hypothetical protein